MRGILHVLQTHAAIYRFIPADAGNTTGQMRWCCHSPVHPRGCGEYGGILGRSALDAGSSPRMRGILQQARAPTQWQRFIPADAGNTEQPSMACQYLPVHPRGCGEYEKSTQTRVIVGGSSPRMRGIPEYQTSASYIRRFIPADAGNTPASRSSPALKTVHPRGCGEYIRRCMVCADSNGSSPRMRGILQLLKTLAAALRFIPADAGDTMWVENNWDHKFGSSPRMRGIPGLSLLQWPLCRFIPADAGNTAAHTPTAGYSSVHPRGCGEYAAGLAVGRCVTGSSPRMRGILPRAIADATPLRFIPADAGNTPHLTQKASDNAVHPRGCGEYHSNPRRMPRSLRFIPADAGNTYALLECIAKCHGSSPRMRGIPIHAWV